MGYIEDLVRKGCPPDTSSWAHKQASLQREEEKKTKMKLCSECKEPLEGELAFTEEGQEDYPWCVKCVDYVDSIEVSGRDESSRSATPPLEPPPLTPTELYAVNKELLRYLDRLTNTWLEGFLLTAEQRGSLVDSPVDSPTCASAAEEPNVATTKHLPDISK